MVAQGSQGFVEGLVWPLRLGTSGPSSPGVLLWHGGEKQGGAGHRGKKTGIFGVIANELRWGPEGLAMSMRGACDASGARSMLNHIIVPRTLQGRDELSCFPQGHWLCFPGEPWPA